MIRLKENPVSNVKLFLVVMLLLDCVGYRLIQAEISGDSVIIPTADLNSVERQNRITAIDSLEIDCTTTAMRSIGKYFSDRDYAVRMRAIDVFSRITDPTVCLDLFNGLHDTSALVRYKIIKAIQLNPFPEYFTKAKELSQADPDQSVRGAAAELVLRIKRRGSDYLVFVHGNGDGPSTLFSYQNSYCSKYNELHKLMQSNGSPSIQAGLKSFQRRSNAFYASTIVTLGLFTVGMFALPVGAINASAKGTDSPVFRVCIIGGGSISVLSCIYIFSIGLPGSVRNTRDAMVLYNADISKRWFLD